LHARLIESVGWHDILYHCFVMCLGHRRMRLNMQTVRGTDTVLIMSLRACSRSSLFQVILDRSSIIHYQIQMGIDSSKGSSVPYNGQIYVSTSEQRKYSEYIQSDASGYYIESERKYGSQMAWWKDSKRQELIKNVTRPSIKS
jgi:hypothetical protein